MDLVSWVSNPNPPRPRPALSPGLLWQIIKIQLLNQINLMDIPELLLLKLEEEDIDTFRKLPPEEILKRWVNWHLDKSGSERRIHDFGNSFKVRLC